MDTERGTWVLHHTSSLAGDVYFVGIEGAFKRFNPDPSRALPFPDRRAAATFAARHPRLGLTPQRRRDDPANILATPE